DVNDALGYKKKAVVVTSDLLALVAEKTKVSKQKEKVVVSLDSGRSGADDFSELKNITAFLAKAFNRRKFYSKPTNNNLRTSSTSQSSNKKQEFVKSDDQKEDKKADVKKRDMSKVKCYNFKKEGHFAKDCKKAKIKDYNYHKTKMLLAKKDMLKDQLQVKHVVIDTHVECHEKYAKLEEERYEYMIRYSDLFDDDKQHRKQIADQEVLFDKMSVELVELDKHVRDLENTVIEKDFKISELEECMCNKDPEIEKCLERLNVCENKLHKMGQTNQTVHMIMPSKDNCIMVEKELVLKIQVILKKKDLRPTLYDEKVIGLGYTPIFLTHSNEVLEIKKFKRSRENKIEFTYDYGNLNVSYVNEKINFEDDYFQEIINLDFEKIDSLFQQTSSLKPYVLNVILKKIIIDLEDEVVKKECDKVENPKVIALGMFKLSMSQSFSQISMSKTSCESNNVENLDTFSSVRIPKHRGVIWKNKGSSNTSNVDLYSHSHLKLNKNVKRYSFKDLLACNNSHLGETSSLSVYNDAMNVSCNSRMCDLLDDSNFFIFNDESVRISPVSKMPFRKKPRDYMNVRSKSNSNKSLPRTVHKWLPKMQPLAELVAKWFPRVERQIDKNSKTPNSLGPIYKWVPKVC
nr:hypothetical protein [Tanacetum cinerariifolium]